jgi:hypothetical protein
MVYGLVRFFYEQETGEEMKETLLALNDTIIHLLEDIVLRKINAIGNSIGKIDEYDYVSFSDETLISLIDAANSIIDDEFESTQRILQMQFAKLRSYGHPLADLVIDRELNLILDENISQYFFVAYFLDELMDMHIFMNSLCVDRGLERIISRIPYAPEKFEKLQSMLEIVLDDKPNIYAEVGRKIEEEYDDRLYVDTYRIYGTQFYDESNEYQNDFMSALSSIVFKK